MRLHFKWVWRLQFITVRAFLLYQLWPMFQILASGCYCHQGVGEGSTLEIHHLRLSPSLQVSDSRSLVSQDPSLPPPPPRFLYCYAHETEKSGVVTSYPWSLRAWPSSGLRLLHLCSTQSTLNAFLWSPITLFPSILSATLSFPGLPVTHQEVCTAV